MDNLKIFKTPNKNKRFSIGSDVSTGRARDYSAFTLSDQYGEEYGVFKGKLAPNQLASLLGGLGKIYNNALVGPESNDIGLAVAEKLQADCYPNLYYSIEILKEKGKSKPEIKEIPGWYTTRKNRPVIISSLEEDIRLDNIVCKDPYFVQEAYTFIYDSQNRPIAMGKDSQSSVDSMADDDGYTDDAIFGKAINNDIRKSPVKSPIILPK